MTLNILKQLEITVEPEKKGSRRKDHKSEEENYKHKGKENASRVSVGKGSQEKQNRRNKTLVALHVVF